MNKYIFVKFRHLYLKFWSTFSLITETKKEKKEQLKQKDML